MPAFSASSSLLESSLVSVLKPESDCCRILFVGDVIGRPGRQIFKRAFALLREKCKLDFVVVNGENAAGGFGITEKIFRELMDAGVDLITMGNHWNEKPEVHRIAESDKRIIIPQNVDQKRASQIEIPEYQCPRLGRSILMFNLLGTFAMKETPLCPFTYLQSRLDEVRGRVKAGQCVAFCDLHAEASSEKQAMLWYTDGVFAAVVGTHTHTPTADERVTRKGTAFITDLGMTGPYESVIGMDVDRSLKRYIPPVQKRAQEVASGDLWFCALLVEISIETGRAVGAHRVQYRANVDEWLFSSTF